ncbi:enoyl-CoA hydratase-related protein [Pelagibius sp. CAU 1746]|uniref:enoyl-CoA hydratase/isomerase family protein n=1 Tax=Pelagibius sp. CAU 1746 TaxID=3140370 RepID=UPI00325B259D
MTYTTLDYDVRDAVAWISFNRPDRFNALDPVMARELCDAANRCSSDRGVRAAVLTGSGEQAFCAGGDVAVFGEHLDSLDLLVKEITAYLHAAISRFTRMRAPLIGAVNGVAAGAGLGLVAACDLVVSAENATFTSAYTRIGLAPDGSSTYFLNRLLGPRRAMELFLTNRVLSPAEALDWGLVNRVVAADKLAEEAGALARQLAEGPTGAHGSVKRLLESAASAGLETQMELESLAIAAAGASTDGQEGIRAFLEKRTPSFTGG